MRHVSFSKYSEHALQCTRNCAKKCSKKLQKIPATERAWVAPMHAEAPFGFLPEESELKRILRKLSFAPLTFGFLHEESEIK